MQNSQMVDWIFVHLSLRLYQMCQFLLWRQNCIMIWLSIFIGINANNGKIIWIFSF